jgi:hypothetical protein
MAHDRMNNRRCGIFGMFAAMTDALDNATWKNCPFIRDYGSHIAGSGLIQ